MRGHPMKNDFEQLANKLGLLHGVLLNPQLYRDSSESGTKHTKWEDAAYVLSTGKYALNLIEQALELATKLPPIPETKDACIALIATRNAILPGVIAAAESQRDDVVIHLVSTTLDNAFEATGVALSKLEASVEAAGIHHVLRATDDALKPVIIALGNNTFALAGCEPVCLTEPEANVLEAFLVCPAMSLTDLERRSGEMRARDILKRIRDKYGWFAPAIHLPDGKGKGGYRVAIRSGPPA